MKEKQFKYLSAADMPLGHYIFYRRTEGSVGLSFDSWSSATKAWKPSTAAHDAFLSLDVFAEPIEESEVLRTIEQFAS